jgi:hypothetical protein
MLGDWKLPDINSIQNTGPYWLLNLVGALNTSITSMVLMTLWRSWYVRNEVIHDKRPPPTEVSKRFLMSYLESLIQVKHHPVEDIIKGKFILDVEEKRFHTCNLEHNVQNL